MSKLIAHHLDGDRSHNSENNFIISCYSCHNLIHKLSIKTEEQRNKINSFLIGKNK